MEIHRAVPRRPKSFGIDGDTFDGIWLPTDEVQWSLWGRRLNRIYCVGCRKEYSTITGAIRMGESEKCNALGRRHSLVAVLEDGVYEGPPRVLG